MDDQQSILDVTKQLLERDAFRVITASDGLEAIQLFKQALAERDPFKLSILDLTIPGGVGGEQTVKAMKKIDPSIKVIAASGYTEGGVLASYSEYGFSAALEKPYTLKTLRQTIHDTLQNTMNE